MAKQQKEKTPRRQVREEQPFIPVNYQHAAAIFALFLSLVIFLNPIVFGGKTFLSADAIASHSWDTMMKEASDQGIFPLWNPYIFCGMPAYASLTVAGPRLFDLSAVIFSKVSFVFGLLCLGSDLGWIIFCFFIFSTGVYTLTFSKLNNKIASLIAALGATFSTYIIMWIMISHNTKIAAFCWLPWIFLLIEKLRLKFEWKYVLFLIPAFHFVFLSGHVQMMFYVMLALGIYFIVLCIQTLVHKLEWKGLLRAGAIAAIAAVCALAMDADKYLSVLEYNSSSIRGTAPMVKEAGTDTKTLEGGLGYDYATSWSFAPGEMMTFLLPSWYGFGPHPYSGRYSAVPVRVNTYWGPQPFVDGPQYMGIVILVFAVIGVVRCWKEPFVQFLTVCITFSMLVAFGREFPLVYDLMYKYFPTFNKFRIPLMILALVQTFIPILAAYGISSLMERGTGLSPAVEKKWKYTLFGLAGFLALAVVGRSIFEDIYSGFFPIKDVGKYIAHGIGTGQTEVVAEFYQFVVNSVMTDLYVALVLLILSLGAVWLYVKGSLKFTTLSIVLIVAVTADLWRVDSKPMEPKEKKDQKSIFATPEYAAFLQKDKSLFRTLTFIDGQPPYDNTLAYWKIQNAYGYHGAKIRAYQDIVDVAGLGNPLVWQLMNVKYIITNKPDSSNILQLAFDGGDRKVYFNRASTPRAFFVNRYEVATGLEILNKMAAMSFNPNDIAYVMENPNLQIDPPQNGTMAEFVTYDIQDFEMKVTATGNNLLFLSEAYYPHGWKAFLDGKEIPIYKLNYLFRGVVIPVGTHKLEMKFEPKSFYIGKTISLIANILLLGGLIYIGYDYWRKRKLSVSKTA